MFTLDICLCQSTHWHHAPAGVLKAVSLNSVSSSVIMKGLYVHACVSSQSNQLTVTAKTAEVNTLLDGRLPASE
jgi:hypothetical protein